MRKRNEASGTLGSWKSKANSYLPFPGPLQVIPSKYKFSV